MLVGYEGGLSGVGGRRSRVLGKLVYALCWGGCIGGRKLHRIGGEISWWWIGWESQGENPETPAKVLFPRISGVVRGRQRQARNVTASALILYTLTSPI